MRGVRHSMILAAAAAVGVGAWLLAVRPGPSPMRGSGSRPGSFRPAGGALPQPELWVLAVGVSQYTRQELNLRFAEDDARAVAAELERQRGGPIYRDVHALVLTDAEVTRASVFEAMERFLGQAGPDDVATIFLAGHGVQDRATRTYYFLPHDATPETLRTQGLRMSDFDEMLRVLRRNVRRVVVMLDTCHSGALDLGSRAALSSRALAEQVAAAEGLYLLAASKPGEESKELSELGHGAFTHALLEGLRGGADHNGDGLISISDLFSFVAHRVPRITGGRQHPYHKIEGTDLLLVAAAAAATPAPAGQAAGPSPFVTMPEASPNSIAVVRFADLRGEDSFRWIGDALRAAINTELSKVRQLDVYSPELFDLTMKKRGFGALEAARHLRVAHLVTGSFAVLGDRIRIDVNIVDVNTGRNSRGGAQHVEGRLPEFFDLQKAITLEVLRRLRVQVTAAEGESIQRRTNTSVDAYRLLLEAEGLTSSEGASRGPGPLSSLRRLFAAAPALAAPPTLTTGSASASSPDAEVIAVLEQYRRAHETRDIDALAQLYVSFSERQREALREYLSSAEDLHVELTDVRVETTNGGVTVTYTRRDRFRDRESGRPVELEVRLTKILVRHGGAWRFAPATR